MISRGERIVLVVLFLAAAGRCFSQQAGSIADEVDRYCAGLPFVMPHIEVPVFPEKRFPIVDYGAVPDGSTMNTGAFSAAISACAGAGGGTVVVPPGAWLTGPITLESNVNLHLERGALIQFSKRIEDFPLIKGYDGKSKKYTVTPPLFAYRATNIAVTGEGVIDGAGEVWRYVKKEKQTPREWQVLVTSGGVVSADGSEWWPSKAALQAPEYIKKIEESGQLPPAAEFSSNTREYLRPDMVQLVQCNGILLDGTTFRNSPKFHVRPIQSENVIVRDIKVFCPWFAQNGDGLDVTSCRNVVVFNATLDVGDDGICLKPGSIGKNQTAGPSCANIVVADCIVYRAHGGFVIGSESFGGVNNVSVRNCVFIDTDVGLRFKSLRGKGGPVEHVYIDGVRMRSIRNEAVLFDMYYGGAAPEDEASKDVTPSKVEPVTGRTPRFQNFSIRNVVCDGATRAVVIRGLPEMAVRNIMFDSVSVTSAEGALVADGDGVHFKDCRLVPESGPDFTLVQSSNVTIEGGSYPARTDVFLKVTGLKSEGIRLSNVLAPNVKKRLELGDDVKPGSATDK